MDSYLNKNALPQEVLSTEGWVRVPTKTWLRVSGPDATSFLQGQCTQDLRPVAVGGVTRALWLTVKGKIVAETLLLREAADVWWIWSPYGRGSTLKCRLEDFIVADDVMVEDFGSLKGTGGWESIVACGPRVLEGLQTRLPGMPRAGTDAWVAFEGGYLISGRRGLSGVWDWVRPVGFSVEGILPGEWEGWLNLEDLELARLRAGVPAIPEEFGPEDLPQEAGLEAVAVSFNKGCYLGQEVMARLQSMGRVRRLLVRVQGEGAPPEFPSWLWNAVPGTGERRKVGELRVARSEADGAKTWIGLAVVNLGLDGSAPESFFTDTGAMVRSWVC